MMSTTPKLSNSYCESMNINEKSTWGFVCKMRMFELSRQQLSQGMETILYFVRNRTEEESREKSDNGRRMEFSKILAIREVAKMHTGRNNS